MSNLSPHQFAPKGDDDAKASLLKQLKDNFPKQALSWLQDDTVRVDAPQRVSADDIDWDDYPDWRAAKQLKAVGKIAKKIDKGKTAKPVVLMQAPGEDEKTIIDGHHHALGYIDAKQEPLAYVVHVPAKDGPWTDLTDKGKVTKHDDWPGKGKK
jgi:hypothetical protein